MLKLLSQVMSTDVTAFFLYCQVNSNRFYERYINLSLISVQQKNFSVRTHIFVMALLLVIAFTTMQPVSAGGTNVYSRFLFFSLHIFPAVFLAWKISGFLFNQSFSSRVSPWVLLAIAGAISGFLLAPMSVFLEIVFGVVDYSEMPTKKLEYSLASFMGELEGEWFAVVPKTTIFWPLMNSMLAWKYSSNQSSSGTNPVKPDENPDPENIDQADPDASENRKADSAAFTSAFIQSLPGNLGKDVIYLRSEEHYLKVVTTLGENLILYGLKNAIHDLEKLQVNGLLVHRSYWVSMKHIVKVDVESGLPKVHLSNGFKVPISRRKRSEVISVLREFQ